MLKECLKWCLTPLRASNHLEVAAGTVFVLCNLEDLTDGLVDENKDVLNVLDKEMAAD